LLSSSIFIHEFDLSKFIHKNDGFYYEFYVHLAAGRQKTISLLFSKLSSDVLTSPWKKPPKYTHLDSDGLLDIWVTITQYKTTKAFESTQKGYYNPESVWAETTHSWGFSAFHTFVKFQLGYETKCMIICLHITICTVILERFISFSLSHTDKGSMIKYHTYCNCLYSHNHLLIHI
jgi:hypothetical protein